MVVQKQKCIKYACSLLALLLFLWSMKYHSYQCWEKIWPTIIIQCVACTYPLEVSLKIGKKHNNAVYLYLIFWKQLIAHNISLRTLQYKSLRRELVLRHLTSCWFVRMNVYKYILHHFTRNMFYVSLGIAAYFFVFYCLFQWPVTRAYIQLNTYTYFSVHLLPASQGLSVTTNQTIASKLKYNIYINRHLSKWCVIIIYPWNIYIYICMPRII